MIDEIKFKVSLKQKNALFMIIVTIIAIMTFDYLTWNPVGYNSIPGVQGRYFIPIASLLLLLFYNKREHVPIFKNVPLNMDNNYKLIIVRIVVITLSLMLFMLIECYYMLN